MAVRVLVVQHAEKERLPGDPGLTEAGHAQAEPIASTAHLPQARGREPA